MVRWSWHPEILRRDSRSLIFPLTVNAVLIMGWRPITINLVLVALILRPKGLPMASNLSINCLRSSKVLKIKNTTFYYEKITLKVWNKFIVLCIWKIIFPLFQFPFFFISGYFPDVGFLFSYILMFDLNLYVGNVIRKKNLIYFCRNDFSHCTHGKVTTRNLV